MICLKYQRRTTFSEGFLLVAIAFPHSHKGAVLSDELKESRPQH